MFLAKGSNYAIDADAGNEAIVVMTAMMVTSCQPSMEGKHQNWISCYQLTAYDVSADASTYAMMPIQVMMNMVEISH